MSGVIDAIVFDLDGVLLDSEPVWEEVRRAVVARWGGQVEARNAGQPHGDEHSGMGSVLSAELGTELSPERMADVVVDQMAERYAEALPLMPGAIAALHRLAPWRPLGLASSSPRRLIDAVLTAAKVADLFATVVSTEEVGRGKPAPDVYRAAAERLAVAADRCVAVEDSSNGLRSAAAAGMVVAVPHQRYPPSQEALMQATVVRDTLDGLTPESLALL